MKKVIIGIMGPGNGATEQDKTNAYALGKAIATAGYVLLTGGRKEGVMDAASRGAKSKDGLTIGILPGTDTDGISDAVDIPIVTGMHNARNNINILSSKVVIACGLGAGTVSEIMLAVKAGIPVVLLAESDHAKPFLQEVTASPVYHVSNVDEAIKRVLELL